MSGIHAALQPAVNVGLDPANCVQAQADWTWECWIEAWRSLRHLVVDAGAGERQALNHVLATEDFERRAGRCVHL